MKLSLIIPLLEAQIPALPLCLEMLSRQTLSEFEVLVIGSSQTESLFSTYANTFENKLQLEFFTSSAADDTPNALNQWRNLGATQATTDTLVFLDANILLNPLALAYYDQAAKAVNAPIYGFYGNQNTRIAPSFWFSDHEVQYLDQRLVKLGSDTLEFTYKMMQNPHWYAWAANCCISKNVFEDLKGFNLDHVTVQGELEFAYRWLQKKHPIYFSLSTWGEGVSIPNASDYHLQINDSFRYESKQNLINYECTQVGLKAGPVQFEPLSPKQHGHYLLGNLDGKIIQQIFQYYLPQDLHLSSDIKQRYQKSQAVFTNKSVVSTAKQYWTDYGRRLRYFHTETKAANRKPDFIIIGSQKSGSTSLHNYLVGEKAFTSSFHKEMQFFNNNNQYQKGEDWYLQHFDFQPGKLAFETTPDYLASPKTAERIFKFEPQMKLIAIIREPVDRAFSAWNMYRNSKSEKYRDRRSFAQAIEDELEQRAGILRYGYLKKSLYADQFENYLKYFKPEQLLILDFEVLKSHPRQILEQCFTFLGLDIAQLKFTKPKIIFNKSNYAHALPENESLHQKLNAFFKPSNTRLKEKFGLDFDWL